MKVELVITQEEAKLLASLKNLGWLNIPSYVIITISDTPVPSGKVASTAPIGQTINGYKVTHYGYPGDSTPDTNSMKGIGDRGNHLTPNVSVALTKSARKTLFGVDQPSTGKSVTVFPGEFTDDDSAPEADDRIDVYDPYYTGVDAGCTPTMYAKSRDEMVSAGILT